MASLVDTKRMAYVAEDGRGCNLLRPVLREEGARVAPTFSSPPALFSLLQLSTSRPRYRSRWSIHSPLLLYSRTHATVQLIFSVFKTLTDQRVTVELKNDLSITGTLKSVDQFVLPAPARFPHSHSRVPIAQVSEHSPG